MSRRIDRRGIASGDSLHDTEAHTRESKRAYVGHIGSALSVSDIIAVLFNGRIKFVGTDLVHRDRFVLSKGHAALALYGRSFSSRNNYSRQLGNYCVMTDSAAFIPNTSWMELTFRRDLWGMARLRSRRRFWLRRCPETRQSICSRKRRGMQ